MSRRGLAVAVVLAMASGRCAVAPDVSRGHAGIPADAPSIRGMVTAREAPDRIRVEADPAVASGSDKAVVALAPATRIVHRDGRTGAVSDLGVGREVSVWFAGPVRESYPLQADAGIVVVER